MELHVQAASHESPATSGSSISSISVKIAKQKKKHHASHKKIRKIGDKIKKKNRVKYLPHVNLFTT